MRANGFLKTGFCILWMAALLACHSSRAQDAAGGNSNIYVVKTFGRIAVSHEGIGDAMSADVSKAADLISHNRFEESGKLLDEVLVKFRALMNDTYVCFNRDKDFQDYMKEFETAKGKLRQFEKLERGEFFVEIRKWLDSVNCL